MKKLQEANQDEFQNILGDPYLCSHERNLRISELMRGNLRRREPTQGRLSLFVLHDSEQVGRIQRSLDLY